MNHRALVLAASGLFVLLCAGSCFAALDFKSMHGSQCVARGPGTTHAEITVGAYGIANPGTVDESVICPLDIDAESIWDSNASPTLYVHFRSGTEAGKLTCTVFVGSLGSQDTATTSYTASATSVAGAMNSLSLVVPVPTWQYTGAPTVSLACTLSPKLKLGGYFLREFVATDAP
jgi:hypothetical protein